MPKLERLKLGVDRLGSLEMQHGDRRAAVPARGVDVRDPPCDAHVTATLERQQAARDRGPVRRGVVVLERGGIFPLDHAVVSRNLRVRFTFHGRREHREDPTAHASRPHPGEVEMAVRPAVDDPRVILAGEHVVVAVEDGLHGLQRSRRERTPGRQVKCRR
jgi:hypothetical protein